MTTRRHTPVTKNPTTTTATAAEVFQHAGKEVDDVALATEVEQSYLEYAYSVIHSRALPDVRDGLKPVHRRILYAMYKMGLKADAPQVKAARVVGEVLGRYHPHGDSSVYDAMVRMAQDFALNTPLVDGHGNWGSVNDNAAAMRYTECRLHRNAHHLVTELGEDTVTMVNNYDGSLTEPAVLPAAFPHLLVNGANGIAVGMSTLILPHNPGEVIAAARTLLTRPDISDDDLFAVLPAPDFPTGGLIVNTREELWELFTTGRGVVRVRAKVHTEPVPGSRGRTQFVFTELPYQVGTEKVIEGFHRALEKKKLVGVADVKDLSDRETGVRLVVECRRGVDTAVLLDTIFQHTPLETSFTAHNLALVAGTPRTLNTRQMVDEWLTFRVDTVRRRTTHRLGKAETRLHIVDGLLTALDNIDEVVTIVRKSRRADTAQVALRRRFKLSPAQCDHILNIQLRRLVALEKTVLRDERKNLLTAIRGFKKILTSDRALRSVVDEELASTAEELSHRRRSTLTTMTPTATRGRRTRTTGKRTTTRK